MEKINDTVDLYRDALIQNYLFQNWEKIDVELEALCCSKLGNITFKNFAKIFLKVKIY